MRAEQAKTIPVESYLESQGVTPRNSRKGGRELWYISPIRSTDNNPSFKVDTHLNCWYDYGIDEGGNTLDLAIKMLREATVSEALKHLDGTGLYSAQASSVRRTPPPLDRSLARGKSEMTRGENSPFELLEYCELQHPALLQYLHKRGIDQAVGMKYLSQIVFKQPHSPSRYFALGFPSGDGYEARNALFKGFVGSTKDVTYFDHPDSSVLLVFEGFIDFLTYLTVKKLSEPVSAVLVLNSGNLKQRAIPHVSDERFSTVQLFLDNDAVGDKASKMLSDANPRAAEDMRTHYEDFNDLNDWHLKRKL